jgi:uncharacterized membrane protein
MNSANRAHRNDGSDDSVIDARIGMLLRVGMLASAAVILSGGVLFLIRHGQSTIDYRVFRGDPPGLNTLAGIVSGVTQGEALAIIQFGLLMLIATPVARVAFSVYAFLSERDYLYVVISVIVLVVLLYSLIWH